MRGLNLAFKAFVFRQILRFLKAFKNRLNLEPKFKTLLLIFFTANFVSLLKNFICKFIKFTKKALRRKLKFWFFESVKQVCFSLSQKAANLSVIMEPKHECLQHSSNNKFAGQLFGIFDSAAFVRLSSRAKFDLRDPR